MASIGGHFWRSPKSAAEVTNALPLVCRFQKGIPCRGKYALFGWPPLEVTFGGHQNQLQRSPMHCPWSAVSKKVYNVGVNMHYLGGLHWRSPLEVTKISCRGHHHNVLGWVFSKRYIMLGLISYYIRYIYTVYFCISFLLYPWGSKSLPRTIMCSIFPIFCHTACW